MVTKGYRVAERAPLSLKDSSITFQQISTRKEYVKYYPHYYSTKKRIREVTLSPLLY